MKVVDVFKEIKKGVNLEKCNYYNNPSDDFKAFIFRKNAVEYGLLIESKFESIIVDKNIEGNFILQPDDIIISVKKPYRVGILCGEVKDKVIVTSNYIILRGLDESKYCKEFMVNYLDKIGISKYIKEYRSELNESYNGDLTISEVMNIELPNIPINVQNNNKSLLSHLNSRSSLCANLMENDSKIVERVLKQMVGDKNGL